MRLSGTQARSISSSRGLGNQLWDLAGNRPSLDLPFAESKSLVDATTGTNLIDFTRASSATYVGSDGLIKTATTNLLLRSEEFDNPSWSKLNSVTVSSNATVAPNSEITADKLIENSDNTSKLVAQTVTVVSDQTYTASVYIKAAERPTVLFHVRNSTYNIRFGGFFNTSTNVFTAEVAGGASLLSSSFNSVGNGWYRCTITGQLGAVTAGIVTLYLANESNSLGYTGDGTSGIYVWGAQLERSSTVGEYIPTTSTINSAPRFDHDPTTGESLGLLVEAESRTNLLLQSEDFSTTWSNSNDVTVSTNQTVAPDGNLTGDLIAADATNTPHNIFQDTVVGSGSYTFSCYIKANGYTTGALRTGLSGNFVNGDFDLTAGTISISTAGTAINGTGDLIDIGDGWFRCWVSASNIGSGSSARNVIYLKETSSFLGDGTSGLYVWGAQLEEGSFPTSYIPTEGSTVTRAADVASISGSNFSSWYNQSEGTVFAEYQIPSLLAGTVVSFDDNTQGNRWQVRYLVNSGRYRFVSPSGSLDITSTTAVPGINLSNKSAYVAAVSDQQWATNGIISAAVGTQSIMPTVDRLQIGNGAATDQARQLHLKRLTYWPTRLPNETLQGITQ